MAIDPITPEKAERMASQTQEFIALEALIVQNRRLRITAVVEDDYIAVRNDWERALSLFIAAMAKNRPDQLKHAIGYKTDPASADLALELVRLGVEPISLAETVSQAAVRALKDKPDGFLKVKHGN